MAGGLRAVRRSFLSGLAAREDVEQRERGGYHRARACRRGNEVVIRHWIRIGILLAAVWVGGCCHPPRTHRVCAGRPRADLLFDAQADFTDAVTARSDWPETFVHNHPFEDITYREVITNHQGRYGEQDDRPYRRFESVRQGRVRR